MSRNRSQAEEARTTELYFPRTWETVSEEGKLRSS